MREREETSISCSNDYAVIGWFLYIPWLGFEPPTLAYGEYALNNWAAQPGWE